MQPKKSRNAPLSGETVLPSETAEQAWGETPRYEQEPAFTGAEPRTETAGDVKSLESDARGAARSVRWAVREQMGQFTSEIGNELGKTAENQKKRGVEAMHAFARAVDVAAGELEVHSPLVARYARDAARRVEGLSINIGGRSMGELMDSAKDLARRRPGLFFAGVVAAGFALSRFVKSSASHDSPPPGGMAF